jgi:signal transduction histidine kinase
MTLVTSREGSIVNRLLERLSPRRSLAAAIGWTLALLFFAGAYLASLWVGNLARKRLEDQTGVLYQQYALQVSNALDSSLYDRLQWLRAMGDVFATRVAADGPARQRALLKRWQVSLPELDWMAYADAGGKVIVATGGLVEGEQADWRCFSTNDAKGAWIGDVRAAEPAEDTLPPPVNGNTDRFIELTAPVRDGDGGLVGVIGAHLPWRWVTALEENLIEGLKSGRAVESLVVDRQGRVVIGPASLAGKIIDLPGDRAPGAVGRLVHRWADGEEYVSGYAVSDGAGTFPGLGWTVWVREPTATAFAAARALEHLIFAGLLLLGLIGAVIGIASTARRMRGLAAIARSADAIRRGEATALAVPPGADEAARIGDSLRMLVDGLQRERASLRTLNAELDARVAARTREVERMSEENKYAAVVRERLRMARDLHDTLAHSLMALLTEIRLLRKLADIEPGTLREELVNAETAAREGLREARAAIAALRHNAVRDIGLGASLAQLLNRFEERKGVAVVLERDEGADALADSRAETLYRIVEEALHNIDRHAGATRVEASSRVERRERAGEAATDVLVVTIADDGRGFDVDAPQPGHFGLRGMREQAELIGARLEVTSSPGQGTRVTIEMPV